MADDIGKRIRDLRNKLNRSRKDVAEAAGISYTALADIENGRQKSSTKLHEIAKALGTTPEYLERGEEADRVARFDPALTPRESALLNLFRSATEEGRRTIELAAHIAQKRRKGRPFTVEPIGLIRLKKASS